MAPGVPHEQSLRIDRVADAGRIALRRLASIDRAASRGSDRRVHARLTPVELQNPIAARLKYGDAVTLVDLSAGGALLETSMFLRPDTDLVLELLDPRTRNVTDVVSRVLRSQVSGLQGGVKYRGACAFD